MTYALVAANVLVFLFTPGMAGSVAGGSDLSQLCHLQAFLDHYAAVPRELIHHQMPQLVPTGGGSDLTQASRRAPAARPARQDRRRTTSRPR